MKVEERNRESNLEIKNKRKLRGMWIGDYTGERKKTFLERNLYRVLIPLVIGALAYGIYRGCEKYEDYKIRESIKGFSFPIVPNR
jgi:hypothetical protein